MLFWFWVLSSVGKGSANLLWSYAFVIRSLSSLRAGSIGRCLILYKIRTICWSILEVLFTSETSNSSSFLLIFFSFIIFSLSLPTYSSKRRSRSLSSLLPFLEASPLAPLDILLIFSSIDTLAFFSVKFDTFRNSIVSYWPLIYFFKSRIVSCVSSSLYLSYEFTLLLLLMSCCWSSILSYNS